MALSLKPLQANTTLMTQRFEGASPELASMPGRQLQQFGQAAMQMGEVGMRIATDMQLEANRVQVTAAQNAAMKAMNRLSYGDGETGSEAGFLSMSGEAALKNPEGISLTDAYSEKLRTHLADIENNLGNDAQKAAFAVWRMDAERKFEQDVSHHQLREFQKHGKSVSIGKIGLLADEAAKNWDKPNEVHERIYGKATPDGRAEWNGIAQEVQNLSKGKSATEIALDVKQATSAAHMGVITAALNAGNVAYAREHLDSYRNSGMLATDILKVSGHIKQAAKTQMAMVANEAGMRDMSNRFAPNPIDQLMISINGETDKGTVLEVDSNAVVQNVRKYGNVKQAAAAVRYGSEVVDQAIAQAQKDKSPAGWVSFMPKGAAEWAEKVQRRYDAQPAPPKPTELEYVQHVLTKLPKDADADTIVATRNMAEHNFRLYEKAIKDREQGAIDSAYDTLYKAQGNWSALTPQQLDAIPKKEIDNLMGFAKKMTEGVSGGRKTDVAKWLEFTNLPPQTLKNMRPQDLLQQFGQHFSDTDLRKADDMIRGLKGDNKNDGLQLFTTQDLMNRTARELEILPKTGKPNAEQESAYVSFAEKMQAKINSWESSNGKKASPEVLSELLNAEKMNIVRLGGWGWGGDTEKPVIALTPKDQGKAYVKVGDEEIKVSSIPAHRRAQIIEALEAGNKPVTEANIATYWVKGGKPK